MNINNLDQNKTEQSISNEMARLDTCRVTLEKLKKEYESKRYSFVHILANYEARIKEIETSIQNGEKFIKDCQTHLNELKNG